MHRRFSSRVRHKGWQTDSHIRGLDEELRSRAETLSRWKEHFGTSSVLMLEVAKRLDGINGSEVQVEEEEIELEKVKREVRNLKAEQRGDGVCKQNSEGSRLDMTMMQWLKVVCDVAWRCEKMPNEWREAVIVPIHEKIPTPFQFLCVANVSMLHSQFCEITALLSDI